MVRKKAIVVVFLFTVSLISIARASTDSKKTQISKSNMDVEEGTSLEKRSKKIADNLVNRMAAEMSQMNDGKK